LNVFGDVFLRRSLGDANARRVLKRLKETTPRQRLVLGSLIASAGIVAASLADARGLRHLDKLRADIARQEQRNAELREANAKLAKTIGELSTPVNPRALEQAAREQLGFVRPGEVLFKFE
jgi:cell division protein FtsB